MQPSHVLGTELKFLPSPFLYVYEYIYSNVASICAGIYTSGVYAGKFANKN